MVVSVYPVLLPAVFMHALFCRYCAPVQIDPEHAEAAVHKQEMGPDPWRTGARHAGTPGAACVMRAGQHRGPGSPAHHARWMTAIEHG